MSLANFFKQLRSEKQVEAFLLVQDNAVVSRDGRSTALYKKATEQPYTKVRPAPVLNADHVAPKLPRRQISHDALHKTSTQSAGSCSAPKLPIRLKSPKMLSPKRLSKKRPEDTGAGSCTLPSIPRRQRSRDKVEKLEPIVEQKRYQNAIFGSPRAAARKSASLFATFCEDTKNLLARVDLVR